MRLGRTGLFIAATLVIAAVTATAVVARAAGDEAKWAAEIVRQAGVSGGVIVHVGCGDGRRTAALRVSKRFVVQGLERHPAKVAAARRYIASRGLYGPVSVRQWDGQRLPYRDNFAALIVVERGARVGRSELLRVLEPEGVAMVARAAGGWRKVVKPRPANIDDWPQHSHGADGNQVAQDTVVGPPKHMQWTAGPRWLRAHDTDSSVDALVVSGNRIAYIVDEAPIGVVGPNPDLPDKWHLACRDAFSGVLLWKIPIKHWGWREWKPTWFANRPDNLPINIERRLAAAGKRLYCTLGWHAPVSEIDIDTGKLLRTYRGTDDTREIVVAGDVLLLTLMRDGKLRLAALDRRTGRKLWDIGPFEGTKREYYTHWFHKQNQGMPVDPVLNAATDGRVVAFIDGRDIVGVDFRTGKQLWRTQVEDTEKWAWVGLVIVKDGVVLHGSPQRLTALSAADGRKLWEQPKKRIGWLWFQWKDVFVVDGLVWTWSADLVEAAVPFGKRKYRERWPESLNGYDLHTGELKRKVPTGPIFHTYHHHRCYRNRATVRWVIASRRGAEFVDMTGGPHSVNNWVRGACHLGMFPANGMLYATPHPCRCYSKEKLSGFNILAPAKPDDPDLRKVPPPEPVRGPAFGKCKIAREVIVGDQWPTFRADMMRSGVNGAALTAPLKLGWRAKLGGRLTAPVVADGKVLVAEIDSHRLVCLDADSGRMLWDFFAGARIDSPPTVCGEAALFGSADGWVYCVRLSDGTLVWKLQAAPMDRFVGSYGQLESAWPVHGTVTVKNGLAYFAAGRSSYLDCGIWLYAVDVASGRVVHRNNVVGPELWSDNIKDNIWPSQGMGMLTDVMQADERAVYMRDDAFSFDLQPTEDNPNRIRTVSDFLDDTYFRRTPWWYASPRNFGRLICHRGNLLYIARMFDSINVLRPEYKFVVGQGYRVICQPPSETAVVRVKNSPSLAPRGKAVSVEAWVYARSKQGAVVVRGGAWEGYGLVLKLNRPRFIARIGKKLYVAKADQDILGQWTHLVGVLGPDKKIRLYVNGKLAAEADAPGAMSANPGQETNIGADEGTGVGDYNSPFAINADIDEVRIYHRALRAEEVRQHYEHPEAVPAQDNGLVLYLPFDDGTAKDASGNGNDGEVVGAKPVDGVRGKALRFTGEEATNWSVKLPIRTRAMVLCAPQGGKGVLAVAGPPDAIIPGDPLAAFEGRAGGELWLMAAADGKVLQKIKLSSPPVFNGLAAAGQSLYMAARDGSVVRYVAR